MSKFLLPPFLRNPSQGVLQYINRQTTKAKKKINEKKIGWRKRINRKNEGKIITSTLRLRIFLGFIRSTGHFWDGSPLQFK